ncbi:MAG TPA: VWA domain-containing protein [Candidatus Acidoferrum sp.]|jgi:Ca-activated chloride channel family protein
MRARTLRASGLALFAVAALSAAGSAAPQDNSDRPPWARKTKPKSSSTNTTPPSSTAPDPHPGVLVNKDNNETNDNADEAAQRTKIKVSVNLVNVLASVLDDNNRPAPDLPVQAFQLFEEGVPQKIEIFEPETKQPLDIVLMIDASLSAHKEITFEQQAASHFIAQVLRPGDRLAVYAFDENVTQIAAFSENVGSLQSAVLRIPPGAGTSIYDAVLLASRSLERRGDERRRVIILVTDGGETTSRADFEAARKEAVRANTLLYSIIVRPVKNENGRNTAGEHAIETITDTTGGAIFFPDSPQDLDIIFDRIDRELRTQYRLGYYPNPRGPANTYRSIEVKVLDNYKVRHRKTYLTGPQ